MKKTCPDSASGITINKHDDIALLVEQLTENVLKKLEQRLPISSGKSVTALVPESMELIPKVRACEILQRCDSTLSKWAASGKLVPVRRGGSLYYKLNDVMRVYNGEQ